MRCVAVVVILCLGELHVGNISAEGFLVDANQKKAETSSYMGREFVLSLIDVLTFDNDVFKRVYISAKEGGHIFIYYAESNTNDSFYIAPHGHVSTDLKTLLPRDGTFVDHVAIRITSNTDIAVLVIEGASRLSPYMYRMAAYVVYPITATKGRQSIAAAVAPVRNMNYISHVMVVALNDGTHVNVDDGNRTMVVNLDNLDTFQYAAPDNTDLRGAVITSNNDVIVLSGTSTTFNTSGYFSLAAQMVQTKSYRYIVPQTNANQTTMVAVLSEDAYNVTMINKTNAVTYTTRGTQTYTLGTEPVSLLTSVFVSLVQYNNHFMAIVPAVTNYLSEYIFVVPYIHVPYKDSPDVNLVAIVPSNASSGLLLDGSAFSGVEERIQSVDDWYTVVSGKASHGFHHMVSQDPAVKFGLLVYSRELHAEYGFYVGMSF